MSEFPLLLKYYFFTHQEVIANPDHKPSPDIKPNNEYVIDFQYSKISDKEYGVQAVIRLNRETSENPPYFFTIAAFSLVEVVIDHDQTIIEKIIQTTCKQFLIGAMREKLAELSTRGPWPTIFLEFISLDE